MEAAEEPSTARAANRWRCRSSAQPVAPVREVAPALPGAAGTAQEAAVLVGCIQSGLRMKAGGGGPEPCAADVTEFAELRGLRISGFSGARAVRGVRGEEVAGAIEAAECESSAERRCGFKTPSLRPAQARLSREGREKWGTRGRVAIWAGGAVGCGCGCHAVCCAEPAPVRQAPVVVEAIPAAVTPVARRPLCGKSAGSGAGSSARSGVR